MHALMRLKTLLDEIFDNVGHYEIAEPKFPHAVYTEYERVYQYFDNAPMVRGWKVQVLLFTKDEFEPLVMAFEDALLEFDIPFDSIGVEFGNVLIQTTDGRDGTVQPNVIRHAFDLEVLDSGQS